MKMTLISLYLQNFKGVKDETYVFDGTDSIVSGANGAGKTTIATSWLWLMADKGVALHSNPDIRPIGVEECTPRVEAVIDIDGKRITIAKQQKRTVSKPNADGISKISLTNSYEINSVPKSERDFRQYLADLGVDFDRFLPLSHADVFTAQKTADMRKTLFDMAKLMSDAEVAGTMDDISELNELLGNYNLEEITAMQKATLRKIAEDYGKEGEILRAKIEGLESGKVEVDVSAMELGRADAIHRLDEVKSEIARVSDSDKDYETLSTEYYQAKNLCFDIDVKFRNKQREDAMRVENDLNEVKRSIKNMNSEKDSHALTIVRSKSAYDAEVETLSSIRKEMADISKEDFNEKSLLCPMCGRKYSEARQTLIKDSFAKGQAAKVDNLKKREADVLKYIETDNQTITDAQNRLDEINAELANLLAEEDRLMGEIAEVRKAKSVGETTEYQDALANMNRIKEKLDEAVNARKTTLDGLRMKECEIEEELAGYQKALATVSVNENIDNQIDMLRKKQIEYEQSKADAEQILYQVSLLNKRKNELLTDDINKNFKYVKWVLFRYAKNGNYEDCCVPTIDGKELGVSTNNALGIRAKVDICEGMQRYYEQSYPILLDNIEAIDTEGRKALVSDSQLIMFAVTDTALTVKEA